MDRLKLAQFNNISNSSNNQGHLFLKNSNIDVNSRIENKCYEDYEQISCAGYSYLHFAAKNWDLASINELIRRNANLVEQGIKHGNTPLHITTGRLKEKKESFLDDEKINEYVGKLTNDKFVETLLSAQVQSGTVLNPKNKDGMSHLHIACTYNHVKAVELFLNAGESTDHATTDKHPLPGYTALHFAVRYSAFEAAELLLKHGADIHLKDSADKSALHCLIERLMDIANFLEIGKRSYCPFYEKERELLESIVEVFLRSRATKDVLDDTGLTLLHVACILKDSTALKNCFKDIVDVNAAVKIDSKIWPGWTPLHFAACFNAETFKILLRNGADLTVKNTKGETPLDLCMQRYSPHIIRSILTAKDEFKNILLTDGSSKLLETLLLMSNNHFFYEWLDKLEEVDIKIPLDSLIWPGYNPLHLAVLNERSKLSKTKMIFEAGRSSSHFLSSDCPRTESVLLDYWSGIMNCLLAKRFNFQSMKNADGVTPLFMAFKLRKTTSVDKILNNIEFNEEDSNGLSYFHIACATGNMKAIEKLVDKENLNKPVKCDFEWNANDHWKELVQVPASSTPLHIAVITKNTELVEYLLKKGANMHIKDKCGLDSIHLSTITESRLRYDMTKLFLDKLIESKDFLAKDKLSCLHIAAIFDYGKAIEKILQKGVSTETLFEPTNPKLRSKFSEEVGKTPLQIAASHRNREAIEVLSKAGADIFSSSGKLLDGIIGHEFFTEEYFISKMKQKKRYSVKPMNDDGLTLLHMACEKYDAKWVKALLKKNADPNCRLTMTGSLAGHWHESTPLEVLVHKMRHWVKPKEQEAVLEIIGLLIEHGADVTAKNGKGRTPIHTLYDGANDSYTRNCGNQQSEIMMSTIEVLLQSQKNFEVNPVDPNGLSHFHLACNRNQLEIVKKFLDCGVDLDHAYDPFAKEKHHAGYTSLHFALERKNVAVARLLIERGANVNVEDLRGDTPLHLALKQGVFDVELIRLILRHGGDINAKNVKGMTPIEYLLMSEAFTLQQFNVMIDNGAVIDLIDVKPPGCGTVGLAILNAEPNNRLHVLKKMMRSWDIKNVIKQGGNAIESAVNVNQKGELNVDFYLNVIEELVDAGCDVDQQDSEGQTALHHATRSYNYEAVKALLLMGANLNVIDKKGESAITKEIINDKHNERRTLTLNLVASQVWKMRNMGLYVNESTKTAAFQVINQFTASGNLINFDLIRKNCLRELAKARTTFVYKLNLEKFLSESDAVIKYARLPESERQAVDAFFNCRENIRQGFPEWAGFLMMQYRKAVARTKMLGPAMQVIFEAGVKLPVLCLAEILQHLNYDELKLLVEES